MKNKRANSINILGEFCGERNLKELTKEELKKKYNIEKADALVLFGGTILYGGDLLASAIHEKIAKNYIIVGGCGHTTDRLRKEASPYLKDLSLDNLSEAEILNLYIKEKYNLEVENLECHSTNCGNNITNLLSLLKEKNILVSNIILMQDATMQKRMEATLRKYAPSLEIINFATYKVHVKEEEGELSFVENYLGLWSMEEYIRLLMGEIPRLSNNEEGYGPRGKNFIAPLEIPKKVLEAFSTLKKDFNHLIRVANPLYASKN